MLTYTFAKGSGESLYEQLYDRIKADILTGRLAAGEKLPSKRTLADHLELSVITPWACGGPSCWTPMSSSSPRGISTAASAAAISSARWTGRSAPPRPHRRKFRSCRRARRGFSTLHPARPSRTTFRLPSGRGSCARRSSSRGRACSSRRPITARRSCAAPSRRTCTSSL